MTSIDFIKMSLEKSNAWVLGLAKDMQDSPLTMPTSQGGNHPMWCVGHMAYSEANLVSALIKGEENPLAHWKETFGKGSKASGDASQYPAYEEVIEKMEEVRATTIALLETLTEEDLDKPSHAPEEMKDFFGTVGDCLALVSIHFSFHGGQIADARRAAGREPLMG
ncbi:MAG: DinB family protein [Planctomycetaceae bacterium]|nr:DinB family protein [Planctomycetaceae bacterium]